jgi:hypothetical protein
MTAKFTLTGERWQLESNYISAEVIFLTLTLAYFARVAMGHLWYNSETNFVGSVNASTLRDYRSARTIRTFKSPALGLMPTAPFRGILYTCRLLA